MSSRESWESRIGKVLSDVDRNNPVRAARVLAKWAADARDDTLNYELFRDAVRLAAERALLPFLGDDRICAKSVAWAVLDVGFSFGYGRHGIACGHCGNSFPICDVCGSLIGK